MLLKSISSLKIEIESLFLNLVFDDPKDLIKELKENFDEKV